MTSPSTEIGASPSPSHPIVTSTPTPTPAPSASPQLAAGPCATTSTLVCDSFESRPFGGAPDPQIWSLKTQSAGDTVTVDSSRAHNGNQSLHVHTQTGGYEVADIMNTDIFTRLDNFIYGRAFVYMETALPSTHVTLVAAGSPLANNNYAWSRYGGQFGALMVNYAPDTGTESWQHDTNSTLPLNQWVCIQWYYNGATTQSRFWIDDVELPHLYINGMSADVGAPAGEWSLPDLNAITIGWEHYPSDSGTDGMDIWYDDVALDGNFIKCAQ